MSTQPILQQKLADIIEQKLEGLILEGVFSPGEKLPSERELAKQFEVSRPSLREAILRLELKKIIVRKQGGGTYVNDDFMHDINDPLIHLLSTNPEIQNDMLETRYVIEGMSAYFSALRATPSDLAHIKESYAKIAAVELSIEKESDAVMHYLIVIVEASHNRVLLHLVQCLRPLLLQNITHILTLLGTHPDRLNAVRAHRENIMNCILKREPEAARDASYHHLFHIEDFLYQQNKASYRQERALQRLEKRLTK